MSVKSKKVIFRVSESFYVDYIQAPRRAAGFKNTSSFLREMLEQLSNGNRSVVGPSEKRDFQKFCTELEQLNDNLEAAVLRTYDLENAPNGHEFQKLSTRADHLLKSIKKKKTN